MTDALVVLCTCPDEVAARGIANALLAAELAACVNCLPGIRSWYRWDGQIREDAEVLLVIKTRQDRYAALEALVTARHPYDVPEIIALPVVAGARGYLNWITQATSGA
ncbi:MAG: divalent-cation tolerance protein CutA [Gammaproteobacteria bacterium]|jgi:periplasmic divalent cation tolerance protein|nr:divalent-cation tolerance protein CutA [Gammaproteobacteria bacterium]